MRVLIIAIISLSLSGCFCEKNPSIESKAKCPSFNSSIKILVEDLNSTHGAVSWSDLTKLENFLKEKKKFNNIVENINTAK